MSDTDRLIVEMMQALHREGVQMRDVGELEARIITLLEKARRINRAASMLPLVGADVAAERLGCSRRTVYNLVHKHRANVVQNREQICAES